MTENDVPETEIVNCCPATGVVIVTAEPLTDSAAVSAAMSVAVFHCPSLPPSLVVSPARYSASPCDVTRRTSASAPTGMRTYLSRHPATSMKNTFSFAPTLAFHDGVKGALVTFPFRVWCFRALL